MVESSLSHVRGGRVHVEEVIEEPLVADGSARGRALRARSRRSAAW